LARRQLRDPRAAAPPGITDPLREAVELPLRLRRRLRHERPPEALGDEVVARLNGALAVCPPARADIDGGAVVAGDRGEAREQPAAPRVAHGRHPIDAPAPRRPAEAAQDGVERLDEMSLILP